MVNLNLKKVLNYQQQQQKKPNTLVEIGSRLSLPVTRIPLRNKRPAHMGEAGVRLPLR